ncbi:hypothetical protein OCF84_21320 (plasmid) [Shewanella xiamenensis]|uniref:Uncharacterized protein n=1 Tax=Shewanella xiamenensis TaxID=332186 RepID=A0ABT6UDQ9_9GAMM|nr:hypothetical protein [Shewanella xiamenensis]MDI5832582.1 hypothetical protein [Shewanella xiamenensis]WHF57800.1 hypothetical protein OCF84_21320 [Shewanella xiamenensis]
MHSEPRIHHLYVATAKYLFEHPKHGIVKLFDPITLKEAKQYQLSPLLLYGITVAGIPFRWMMFSPKDAPISIKHFLNTAWEHAEGLRGVPDILRVNKYLNEACPMLADALLPLGVELQVTTNNDRSHSGSLRSAQESARNITMTALSTPSKPQETPIDTLCRYSVDEHCANVRIAPHYHSGKNVLKIMQWLRQPFKPMSTPLKGTELDWQAGDWLSSWEKALPDAGSRYFEADKIDHFHWLMTGKKLADDQTSDEVYHLSDSSPELIKMLLANWPCEPLKIAEHCGITLKDLNGYIKSGAKLPCRPLLELKRILGIGVELGFRFPHQTVNGPYVLLANKPNALDDFYNEYTGGGDSDAFEIIPENKNADPSYRYFLIVPTDKLPCLVMVPRGSSIADRIHKILFNYSGIVRVEDKLYRDAVSTCASVAANPIQNIEIMTKFAKILKE